MKLTYTEDCMAYNLDIDNKEIEDFTLQEQKDILKSLIDKHGDNSAIIQNMIIDFLELNGISKFISHCDDCGDNVYEYTLEI